MFITLLAASFVYKVFDLDRIRWLNNVCLMLEIHGDRSFALVSFHIIYLSSFILDNMGGYALFFLHFLVKETSCYITSYSG
jgi:hypothetical protein